MNFRPGSSSDNLPSRASRRIDAAVNCFETEPALKIVSVVFRTQTSVRTGLHIALKYLLLSLAAVAVIVAIAALAALLMPHM
jgi:hypothetical protein